MPLQMMIQTPRGERRSISFCESTDLREVIDTMYEGALMETNAGPVTPEAATALAESGKLPIPIRLTGPAVTRARRECDLERCSAVVSAGCAALVMMGTVAPRAGPYIWAMIAAAAALLGESRAPPACGCAWGIIAGVWVKAPFGMLWRAMIASVAPECCGFASCDPVCACTASSSRAWCSDVGYNASALHVCDGAVSTVEQIGMYVAAGVLATLILDQQVGRGLMAALGMVAAARASGALHVAAVRFCYANAFGLS